MKEIRTERIKTLNDEDIRNGDYVLYWMQKSQRTHFNHALEYAIERGNDLDLPIVVYFGLTDDFPRANLRHYSFLLEGLEEVAENLRERKIKLVVRKCKPWKGAKELGENAALVVTDRAYLNETRSWRDKLSESLNKGIVQVESDVVVPIEEASEKEEYAAYTIRDKINDRVPKFLNDLNKRVPDIQPDRDFTGIDIKDNKNKILKNLDTKRDVAPSPRFKGGESEAGKRLKKFLNQKLEKYPELSNDPTKEGTSNLSPYLHFGHISPIEISLKVKRSDASEDAKSEFLEQLIVRRELAMNFAYYSSNYSNFDSIDGWARETLEKHRKDDREHIYSEEELENGETHDRFWNAAQNEMRKTGKMHNYMRMYWGKKILEWTENPEKAYEIAVKLNDKYELDGRDPNGYAGIAWVFGKHDRAWKERPIFGKVRYMSSNGLKRKFDPEEYVKKVKAEPSNFKNRAD